MPRGTSLTAELVCALRALETARPPEVRVLSDPYAERFLRPAIRALIRGRLTREAYRLGLLPVAPGGVAEFVVGRHRYIDDALLAAVGRGVRQVVILGAGYDARPHRFADELAGVTVYELDFPDTQARKRGLLAGLSALPGHAHYVAVDFERDGFDARLRDAGFAVGAPTFVIWEGVAMYLREATVIDTLARLRGLAGEGSEVVADFWHHPSSPPAWRESVRVAAAALRTIGEPLGFDLAPARAAAFLADHGFRVDERLDQRILSARYGLGTSRSLAAPLFVLRASLEAPSRVS